MEIMKNNLKFYLISNLLAVFILSFWQCEKDNISIEPETEKNHFEIDYVKIDEIPLVSNHLNKSLKRDINSKTSVENQPIFDLNHVMAVIDSVNNTNYSISFFIPDTPLGTFYNLVVEKDSTGTLKQLFVLRFESDLDYLEQFVESSYNIDNFKGEIYLHKYTDFFELGSFNKASSYCPPQYDEYGDPIYCERSSVSGSSTGGGGSATTGGGSNTSGSVGGTGSYGGNGGRGITITYEPCYCHSTHAPGGCTHPIIRIDIKGDMKKGSSKSQDDCPDCSINTTGGVGVNAPRIVSKLISVLGVSDTNIKNWIENPDNFNEVEEIHNWLNGNVSEETKTEALMRIDANRAQGNWVMEAGSLPNRPSLSYTHTYVPNYGEKMYLLKNGLVLYKSSRERVINKESANTLASTEVVTDGYYYIHNYDTGKWYEYRLPEPSYTDTDLTFLFDGFWRGAKIVGRYATPLEDVIILIDGKDFDGVEQDKVKTAGFMIVGLIPGGKAFKPVAKIINGVSKYRKIVKVTVNGIEKSNSLPIKITYGRVDFGSQSYNNQQLRKILNITNRTTHAHHIIPFDLRELDIVQKAAKSDNVFHISEKLNGIPIPSTNHLTGHNSRGGYSDTVRDILIEYSENNPNIDYNGAYNFLNGLTNHIKQLIEANPNMNMGQISNLISYP